MFAPPAKELKTGTGDWLEYYVLITLLIILFNLDVFNTISYILLL